MTFDKKLRKNYDRTEPSNDYLKYWKAVKHWAKATYGLGSADIEMMLFLYSEGLFTRKQFEEFYEVMSWDKMRFHKLLNDKWIIVWRERIGKESKLYELGFKGKKLVSSIYKKLNMQETISESPYRNPIFKSDTKYSNKVYRKIIKEMNESIRQQQRHAPE